jgi:uncharacterized protein YcnI
VTLLRRGAATAGLTTALMAIGFLGAAVASAHVTVNSPGAAPGGYAVITFRVPTESATASTTGIKVQLPADQPLASVSVQPHPGWSYTVTKTKLAKPISSDDGDITDAVSVIDWKADSAATAIKPGEFDQFLISAGPLPDAASMTFKAIQTYSDQSIVSWIEQAAPGSSAEPNHPAPVLTLTASATSATTSNSAPSPSPTVTAAATNRSTDDGHDGGDATATTGLILGIVGVVLGAAALLLALRRRPV